jgi:S-adenosylmethionine hydrolase
MAVVTFTTDFGTSDSYVGTMKGVVLSLAPDASLVDITHGIPRHDIKAGAMALAQAARYFPPGTIHTAVVDPGVGGERADVVVAAAGQLFVGPDNGLLAMAATSPRRVFRITASQFKAEAVSPTFHGRDVFAVTAGRLASGWAASDAGPELPAIAELALRDDGPLDTEACGEVVHVDGFGNLITSFSGGTYAGQWLLRCEGQTVELTGGHTFSDVAPGAWVLYLGSAGRLEIAMRNASAAAALQARVGSTFEIRRKP